MLKITLKLTLLLTLSMTTMSVKAQTISLISYNTWLLPRIFMTAHKPHKRVKAIANYFQKNPSDIIALQEVFLRKDFNKINNILKKQGYKGTDKPRAGRKVLTHGLAIFSKHPIIKQTFVRYRNCAADDCFSNKGIIAIKIQVADNFLYIVNTHMQASESKRRIKARLRQTLELKEFLSSNFFQNDGSIIIMGDFNINKYSDEYDTFVKNLHLNIEPLKGELKYSSDGILNDQKRRKKHIDRELIDYIISFKGPPLRLSPNRITRPKGSYLNMKNIDLSDHFSIEANYTF
jgi:endonuclease/exonuclease/phosphatase family metal-dependent hydrolase